jgi:hypothetical protein
MVTRTIRGRDTRDRRGKAEGYGVSIDEEWYRLAPSADVPLAITTDDSLAARIDEKASVYENVPEVGYVFARNNLTGGEGLDWYPRISQAEEPRPLDSIRFWDSHNIEIEHPTAGQQYRMSLARPFVPFFDPGLPPADMAESGSFLYVASGFDISQFDGWGSNLPIHTFTLTVEVARLVATGSDELFVLGTDGSLWYRGPGEPDFTQVYDPTVDGDPITNIWWAKERLLAERYDPTQPGAPVSLMRGSISDTTPGSSPTWALALTLLDTSAGRFSSVIDAGVAIVAAVGDGSLRSYVLTPPSAGGAPELELKASYPMPKNEDAFALGFVSGVLLFITIAPEKGAITRTVRLYKAQVLDARFDFVVGGVQLLRTWVGTTEDFDIRRRMPTSRDRVFWFIKEGDGEHLWSYDAITSGVMRVSHVGSDVTAGNVFNGILGAITPTEVLAVDTDHFCDSGYLITPNINFGLNTPINWVAVVVEADNLETAGHQVELWGSTVPTAIQDPGHSAWQMLDRISNPAHSGRETVLSDLQSDSLALMVRVFATRAGAKSPHVTRIAVRGIPAHRDWVVNLPINVSDTVTAPGRMPYQVPHLGDQIHSRLLDYSGDSVQVHILDPPFTMQGVVDRVAEPTETISPRGGVGRICSVVVRGTKLVGPGGGAIANEGLGIGLLGVTLLGVETPLEEQV